MEEFFGRFCALSLEPGLRNRNETTGKKDSPRRGNGLLSRGWGRLQDRR